MGFAKDVQLLSMRFQVDSYWIGWSKKDICSYMEYVLARWIWEHVVGFFVAIFGKYNPHTNCYSGTGIGRQHCYDKKQVVHFIGY